MTNGFQGRLATADRLRQVFIDAFNNICESHKIFRFGISDAQADEAHDLISNLGDPTAQLIRYAPDAILVETARVRPPIFIEFKTAETGVQRNSFLATLSAECPDMAPPFASCLDIFGMEADALDAYLRLQQINIPVIVVGHAAYRDDNPLRAQYAHQIARCNVYNPNTGVGTTGSGTAIANVNFASFQPVQRFFSSECGIRTDVLQAVEATVLTTPAAGQ